MKKIIVVDDYKDFADSAREYIENYVKQETEAFYDTEQALEYINNEKDVDILVIDYQMPKMTGFDFAKKVIESFPNIKIIIWSGHDKSTLKKENENYNLNVKFLSKSDCNELIKYIIATRSDLN